MICIQQTDCGNRRAAADSAEHLNVRTCRRLQSLRVPQSTAAKSHQCSGASAAATAAAHKYASSGLGWSAYFRANPCAHKIRMLRSSPDRTSHAQRQATPRGCINDAPTARFPET